MTSGFSDRRSLRKRVCGILKAGSRAALLSFISNAGTGRPDRQSLRRPRNLTEALRQQRAEPMALPRLAVSRPHQIASFARSSGFLRASCCCAAEGGFDPARRRQTSQPPAILRRQDRECGASFGRDRVYRYRQGDRRRSSKDAPSAFKKRALRPSKRRLAGAPGLECEHRQEMIRSSRNEP